MYNGYPYYVYNGYMHRYSDVDRCDFELVDGWSNEVVQTYNDYSCNYGYDVCADDRSYYNDIENEYRYFCSERFSYDDEYDYDWDYDRDFYHDAY